MPKVTLSNGCIVEARNAEEAELILAQVSDYFGPDWQLQSDSIVVDLGANIGLFTLECLRRTDGQARVVCCEPAPPTYRSLSDNLTSAFPRARVSLLPIGVSDQPATARFLYRPSAPAMSSLKDESLPDNVYHLVDQLYTDEFWETPFGKRTPRFFRWLPRRLLCWLAQRKYRRVIDETVEYDCQLKTLSQLIDELALPRVDVLKIDVEGAEWRVLQGIEDRHWPLINAVLLELRDVDDRLKRSEALFRQHGLTNIRIEQEKIFRGSDFHNIIASRPAT